MLKGLGQTFAANERVLTGWLVIAVMAVSATKLRLELIPVGIGEVMLLGWVLWVARGSRIAVGSLDSVQGVVTWFWMLLGVFIGLGALWARSHDIVSPGAGRDTAAFTFAALFSIIAAGVIGHRISTMLAMRWTVAAIAVYLGTLGVVHLLIPAIVTSAPQEFGSRLTGLANNPNQLALYLAPFPAIVIFLLTRAETTRDSALLLAALVLGLLAGRAVASDSLALAWLAAALAWIRFRHKEEKKGRTKWVAIAVALVFTLSAASLLDRFLAFLAGDDAVDPQQYWELNQVGTRLGLWRSGLEAVGISPLVGLGPGRHAGHEHALEGEEAHNSFLDLATMAGVTGALLLIWLFVALGRPRRSMGGAEYAACVILLTLAIYASFHFVVRQPIFWFYLLLAGAMRKAEG